MIEAAEKYDAIVVLGSRPDTSTWEFPAHVMDALHRAALLYIANKALYIIVSGKWTLSFDEQGIVQPFRECDKMADYLITQGVPAAAILKEGESKDTISNFFYIKRQLLKPRQLHKLLFIAADFRLERVRFLAAKVLGPEYVTEFLPLPSSPIERYPNEQDTLKRTQEFLRTMPDGDDSFLEDKFYETAYYR